MPRHRRLEIAGAIYHVMTRGIERREIFKDDHDRGEFVRRFGEAIEETGSKCYGWVLMPNHIHLIIRTGTKPLSDLMRRVLTGYAVYFNHRHKRSGYLYQNRYKSVLCEEDTYLLELVRYIHLNPYRGRIVKSIAELDEYKWSGHSTLVGINKTEWQSTGAILERFAEKKSEAIKKYREFIKDGQNIGKREDLIGGGLRRSAGGWEGVLELKRHNERWRGDERILGDGDFVSRVLKLSEETIERKERLKRAGWNLEKVVGKICNLFSIDKADLYRRSRLSKISQARELLTYWGKKELGISGKQLSTYLGVSKAAITKSIRRGEQLAMDSNLKLIS